MRRFLTMAAVGAITFGSLATARADDAYILADQGMKRIEAGDYEGALVLFKRSMAIKLITDVQCNVGAVYYKLKRWAEAHLYLGMCLSRTAGTSDAVFIAEMGKVYAATEKKLQAGRFAPVSFAITPPSATVRVSAMPKDVEFTTPRVVWLRSGEHRVDATAPGYKPGTGRLAITRGKPAKFELTLDKQPVLTEGPSGPPQRRSKASAWIGLSVGAAGLIAGGVFYYFARDAAHDAEGLSADDPRYADLQQRFDFRRLMSYSLLGAGAVATMVGTYLLVRASRTPERRSVGASLSPAGGIVWARFRF